MLSLRRWAASCGVSRIGMAVCGFCEIAVASTVDFNIII
jgi:hypothetical protein